MEGTRKIGEAGKNECWSGEVRTSLEYTSSWPSMKRERKSGSVTCFLQQSVGKNIPV